MKTLFFGWCAAIVLAGAPPETFAGPGSNSSRSDPAYKVTALGRLPGLGPFLPLKINTRGDIAGIAVPGGDIEETRLLLYRNGRLRDLMPLLPPEFRHAVPLALTDNGKILVTTYTGAFFVVDGESATDFRDIAGAGELWPGCMNSRGEFAGAGRAPDGSWQAFRLAEGQLEFLGGLPGLLIPKRSEATSLSESGHVAGLAYGPNGPIAATFPGGEAASLGLFIGNGLVEVNGLGHVAGATYRGRFQEVFLWRDGVATFPSFPPEMHSTAFAINDRDEIVGSFQGVGDAVIEPRAFLYSGGTVHDLNQLAPARGGWVFAHASDISEHGAIIGQGARHGEWQGFLLRPVLRK